MDNDILELIDMLEVLVSDLPLKAKDEVISVIENLQKSSDMESILKVRDDLESISNMSNIDSYSRNELMNAIALLETIVNS